MDQLISILSEELGQKAEYVENVVKERKDWDDLYKACKDIKL